jgi:hypothetical protein
MFGNDLYYHISNEFNCFHCFSHPACFSLAVTEKNLEDTAPPLNLLQNVLTSSLNKEFLADADQLLVRKLYLKKKK